MPRYGRRARWSPARVPGECHSAASPPQCIGQPPMRPLQPGSNAAQALVAEANALWAAASQAVRRANRWAVNGTTAFPSASAPLVRMSRTSAMMMRDDLGHVRTVRCSIELRVLVQEPLRSSPQFRARVNRLADLKACTCKAAHFRLPSAGWGPFVPPAAIQATIGKGSRIRPRAALTSGTQ